MTAARDVSMRMRALTLAISLASTTLALSGCGSEGLKLNTQVQAYLLSKPVSTSVMPQLFGINLADATIALKTRSVSGLALNESILDMDYRSVNGVLYALTNKSRIISINTDTGAITAISNLNTTSTDPTTNVVTTSAFTLDSNASYSADFNPVADRLRVIGNNGENLRVDVSTGIVTIDSLINPTGVVITGSAYTDVPANGSNVRSTQLFTIDTNSDQLYLQTPPNSGTETNARSLGVAATAVLGYDIVPVTNSGYALLTVADTTGFYRINQTAATHAASAVSGLPGGTNFAAFAIAP